MTSVVELFLQELLKTEPANAIINPPPYYQKDRTKKKVQLTYQALRNTARLRNNKTNCFRTLAYTYYLGELLETKPKTLA